MERKSTGTDHRRDRVGQWLLAFGMTGALAAGIVWWVTGHRPAAPAEPVPFTDLNPFGANFFLDREVEAWKREETLAMAQEAGIGWIKQLFSWEEIEPRQKGEFDWEKYDRIVDLAQEHSLSIIARLDRPPDWSRQSNQFKTQPPDSLEDYGDFVAAFVRRYSGRVGFVQIWNEPNLSAEWGFQRVDAVAYTRLLEVAYRRAKEADPNIVVLSAPLAITLEDASMRGNHDDLVFLEEMYQAGAGAYFDILSANAFGLDRPPEDPPEAGELNFRRVELQRAIMDKYGDGHKPVWINEYGWNAAPASFGDELLTWERVTEAEQAEFTVRGIRWARENWPWLGVVNIWYFRQVGDIPPERPAYYFAMVDPEFEPKPVYLAVQHAATAGGAGFAGPGRHEETSQAVSAPGWRLELDAGSSAGSALSPGAEVGPLAFRFEGRRLELVTQTGQEQGSLLVNVDGKAPTGLPTDGEGRATIDLRREQSTEQATVLLACKLEAGAHILTLLPAGPEPVVVDGFVVSDQGSMAGYLFAWGVCAVLVLAGGGLWIAGARGGLGSARAGQHE